MQRRGAYGEGSAYRAGDWIGRLLNVTQKANPNDMDRKIRRTLERYETRQIDTARRVAWVEDLWHCLTDREIADFLRTNDRQVRRDRDRLDVQKRRDDLEHKFLTGRLKKK
jgi:hypothetical protein